MKLICLFHEQGKWPCCRSCHRSHGRPGFKAAAALLWMILAGVTGCISDLEISPPETSQAYIVEGYIDLGGYPRVLVSRSLKFNSTIGTADLFDLLVTDAQVTVRSGNEEEVLSLVKDTMYAVIPVYRGFRIRGETGGVYSLEVKVGNRVFTSTDTLLAPIRPDSLWFEPEPGIPGSGLIHMRLSDPPEPGNFYRLVAKRLGIDDDYQNLSGNLLDDRLFSGKSINYPLIRTESSILNIEDAFFREGQTVVVKTCVLSKIRFNYLASVSDEIGTTLSPLNIQTRSISLIDGGAMGGWCCYGISLDTLHIKPTQ